MQLQCLRFSQYKQAPYVLLIVEVCSFKILELKVLRQGHSASVKPGPDNIIQLQRNRIFSASPTCTTYRQESHSSCSCRLWMQINLDMLHLQARKVITITTTAAVCSLTLCACFLGEGRRGVGFYLSKIKRLFISATVWSGQMTVNSNVHLKKKSHYPLTGA